MTRQKKLAVNLLGAAFSLLSLSCTKHEIETRSQVEVAPIEVKPIHITIDINLRVERALDDVFKDIDDVQMRETKVEGGKGGKN